MQQCTGITVISPRIVVRCTENVEICFFVDILQVREHKIQRLETTVRSDMVNHEAFIIFLHTT